MLSVTGSGCFTWRGRPTSTRNTRDAELKDEIERIPAQSQGRSGVPRVHAELRAAGTCRSRRRVARLMHQAGLRGKIRKTYKSTTQADSTPSPAENLLHRNVEGAAPHTVWASDMSCLPTTEGWRYLAVVLDLHAWLVVGGMVGERLTTDLPLAALKMALDRRRPPPGRIHHSERGNP